MTMPRNPGGGPVLLLAEDDPDAAFLLERVLRKVSPRWTVHWVGNGAAAVDYIADHGFPSLIVTDLQMPQMDGYELIAWLRAQPSGTRPPIYVLSSSLDGDNIERCRQLGADDFIPKQSCLKELENHLRRML